MNLATYVIQLHATPDVFAEALIFSGAMGLVGGLIPAIHASPVTPVDALRDWSREARGKAGPVGRSRSRRPPTDLHARRLLSRLS